jgi:uncharacterized Zn finger protein
MTFCPCCFLNKKIATLLVTTNVADKVYMCKKCGNTFPQTIMPISEDTIQS